MKIIAVVEQWPQMADRTQFQTFAARIGSFVDMDVIGVVGRRREYFGKRRVGIAAPLPYAAVRAAASAGGKQHAGRNKCIYA